MHHRGKRKKTDLPSAPPPAKAPFPSTECLLLSLLRQGGCDEADSPMRDVLSGKLQSRSAALKGGGSSVGVDHLGGSCVSLSTAGSLRYQTRSCSLETILDDSCRLSRQKLFLSSDSLASCGTGTRDDSCAGSLSRSFRQNTSGGTNANRLSVVSVEGLSVAKRSRPLRPRSVGSCLDIVVETKEEEEEKEPKWQGRSTGCLNASPSEHHHPSDSSPTSTTSSLLLPSSSHVVVKSQGSNSSAGAGGPRPAISTSNLQALSAPTFVRRCLSSIDISKRPQLDSFHLTSVVPPNVSIKPPQPKTKHSKSLPSVCLSVNI